MPVPIAGVTLDHVAVAVERWSQAWPRYVNELGGEWASGGLNVGFGPAQLRYANGARIEVLQPWQAEANPFLRRFLDRHGPGPHHMTFKVPDLAAAVDSVQEAGFSPVGVDLSDPGWKEAFLHPHQATGIVVQLAQAAGSWESPPPEGFPTGARSAPAALVRLTHAVASLTVGLALFERLLSGRAVDRGTAPDGSWEYVDLMWDSPPVLRLVAPASPVVGPDGDALAAWLGGRGGRLHHLAFSTPSATGPDGSLPARAVPGLGEAELPAWVVEPERNLGVRLVVGPAIAAGAVDRVGSLE
jgi:hypothetical protein